MSNQFLVDWSSRLYSSLLVLYPLTFRECFADEMVATHRNMATDALKSGKVPSLLMLWCGIFLDLTISVPREHCSGLFRQKHVGLLPEIAAGIDIRVVDQLTDRAKLALTLAFNGSPGNGKPCITPLDIFVGVTREKTGYGATIAGRLNSPELHLAIAENCTPVRHANSCLSRESLVVLEAATTEAQRLGCSFVGTEHLLFGVLSVADKSNNAYFKHRCKEHLADAAATLSKHAVRGVGSIKVAIVLTALVVAVLACIGL